MTMLTHSEVEIDFDFDPCVVADQLCRGVQPAEEMEACRSLCDAIGREFAEAAFQLLSSGTLGAAFSAFERQVMTASQACVGAVLKAGIESLDDGARHVFRGGRRHRRVQATPRRLMTSAGPVEYSRPRYRSESGAAIMPVDEQVCFAGGYFTERAAEQGVFLMSALSPRDCVSLYGRFGIDGASVSSLQRLTADAGRLWSGCADDALVAMRAGEAIPAQAVSVCISLDGTMLPMFLEGKGVVRPMIWKEASVGTISCYDAQGVRLHTVYFGEMPEPRKATLKQRLEEELVHATRLRPDLRLVAVADAAADNWTYLSALVPEAFQLIDFWHAAQHLGAAAEHIFPQDSTARSMWFKRYRRILRDDPDGAEKVIRSLRYYWTASGRLDAGLESELNYFRNHRNRMNYAKHQAMNVPIGSGVTESACKTLVGARMKRSGQRWGMEGGKAILAFRALVKSGRFDAAWNAILDHREEGPAENDNRFPQSYKAAA